MIFFYLFTVYVWIHITLRYINDSRLLNYVKKEMFTHLLSLLLLLLERVFPYKNINTHYLCKELQLYIFVHVCLTQVHIGTNRKISKNMILLSFHHVHLKFTLQSRHIRDFDLKRFPFEGDKLAFTKTLILWLFIRDQTL